MFRNVIVRRPSRSMIEGITTADLGLPDYDLALRQHDQYIQAMEACGAKVTVLPAMEEYPDSCFVEDVAVVTPKCAIITNPGAPSRNGEKAYIVEALRAFYPEENIEYITEGTIEGGDVMMVGDHYYVGLSRRTNEAGFENFRRILEKYGMTATAVPVRGVLHLKTGVDYLSDNGCWLRASSSASRSSASLTRRPSPRRRPTPSTASLSTARCSCPRASPRPRRPCATWAMRRFKSTPRNTARSTAVPPACRCASKA